MGLFLHDKGNYREAVVFTQKASIAAPDKDLRAACLGHLSELYLLEGRYSEAESALLQAIDLSETVVARRLRRLGALACARHKYDEGIFQLQQSLKMAQKLEDSRSQADILNDLANANCDNSKPAAAALFYRQAKELLQKRHENTVGIARLYDDMGLAALLSNRLSEAESDLQSAKRIFENLVGEDSALTGICTRHLTMVFRNQNRLFDAEALFRRALETQTAQMNDKATIPMDTACEYAKLLRIEHRNAEVQRLLSPKP